MGAIFLIISNKFFNQIYRYRFIDHIQLLLEVLRLYIFYFLYIMKESLKQISNLETTVLMD